MKTKLLSIVMVTAIVSLFADTYTGKFTTGNNTTMYWSGTTSQLTWDPSPGVSGSYPPSGSDIILTVTSGANNANFNYNITDTSYLVNSLFMNGGTSWVLGLPSNTIMNITTNFTFNNNANNVNRLTSIVSGAGTLIVGGNLYHEGTYRTSDNTSTRLQLGSGSNTLAKINVAGNLVAKSSRIEFNVANGATIAGLVDMQGKVGTTAGTYYTGSISLNFANSGTTTKSVRFGALQSEISLTSNGGLSLSTVATAHSAYLTFTGYESGDNKTFTYNGSVSEVYSNARVASENTLAGRLNIVMAASDKDFTQVFAGQNFYKGETILTKGKLKFSADTNIGSVYLGYDTTRNETTDVVESKTAKSNADTSLIVSKGFRATDLNWSSGSIIMSLTDMAETDIIMNLANLFLVGVDQYMFDFMGTAVENSTYTLVSLDNAVADKDVSKFVADTTGIFSWDEAGKLLSFTAIIPEPSEIASLFAIIALGFVAYRRRK